MSRSQTVNIIDKILASLDDRNANKKNSAVAMLRTLTCFPKGSGAEAGERVVQHMLDRDPKGLVAQHLTAWSKQVEDERLQFCAAMALRLKASRERERSERERRQQVVVLYVNRNGRVRYAR